MKIILLQDVAKVGRKNEVKDVNDGFARNFLLGKGKAILATPGNLARVLGLKQGQIEQTKKTLSLIDQLFIKMGESSLVIKAKTSDAGHLFAAIHAKEIAEAIRRNHQVELPTDLIILDKPLKEIGETKIALKSGDSHRELVIKIEAL